MIDVISNRQKCLLDIFRYNQKGFDIIKDIFFNRFG